MRYFTLKQLHYFSTVVQTESIAQASRKLHIAQPSISIAIKNLEDSFGQQLLIRHHAQGVSLTPSGRRFYDKAVELLRLSHEFEQNTLANSEITSGKISIASFESVAPMYIPQLIAGFKKKYPDIEIQLHDGEQHELMVGLHRGQFDLALLYDLDLDHSICKEELNAPYRPYALLPANHPLASKGLVSLAELSREPMILLDIIPSRNYFLSIFTEKGLHPEVAYASPSIEMVRCMVGQGQGFSLLVTRPHSNITYDGQELACVEISDEMESSRLIMAYLKTNEPTKPAQLFMDYCRRCNFDVNINRSQNEPMSKRLSA
ncbi:LysR family transcriptional regulator [Celerinatantimonas diazotrophica]|uniref:DNA-binding transcriptional LysR family regulator n=1 Tax=Celerinatantimonas diazotrophica TaxID=412034 RepID=A0A4R1K3F0_9GAMM|nr:LysR family transcriptional regulator [Celerinatantimonas diazotrophica]TCK58614.1 DNA-binding transcriptional LysR family regulator [Celerinatantimonas diazotrophica]CAG9297243.1 HTH-type transcriptional regulator ArgP [Celerinatantimonas diazotrophica]